MEVEDANHRAFMRARQDGTLTQYDVPSGHYVGFVNGNFVGHHNDETFLRQRMDTDYGRFRLPVYIAQL
ncbi:MAG: hypothetical protein HYT73_02985 [Candidatus Aenigmarchaeota archaeon]|nr:hypothetical protein [Candidatus Aenigmarchaeota archaeon]